MMSTNDAPSARTPKISARSDRRSPTRQIRRSRSFGFIRDHGPSNAARAAVTAALKPNDAHVFQTAGFEVRERLHVLQHDLSGDLGGSSHPLRRARRRDRPAVLDVDRLAFESFWHLGPSGLDEALNATSSVRFRVAETDEIVGYAVCGRAYDIGYLQRLAVHPLHLRRGIGAALVQDSLRWLRRRRGRMMLVNTQESNAEALALYQRLGFRMGSDHLTVLSWTAPS